jgi:PPK2 family polyphosphate:nucleotide phosphotransferase
MKLSTPYAFRKHGARIRLKDIPADPPKGLDGDEARTRLEKLGTELFDLQDSLWGSRLNGVLIVLQGRDAAGKDGAIKNVAGFLNPRGVSVTSFGVPTKEELEHDFLWRVHRHCPRHGEVALFNRSHYEDVLVARVRELVPKKVWKARYAQIAGFEDMLAAHGTIVLKYFLHITREEQEERLLEREKDPHKAWKLNVNDWRERECWDDYTRACEDAMEKTARKHAPWIVVPSNAKWHRDLVIAETLVEALRPHRQAWDARLEEMGREGRKAIAAWRKR